VRILRLILSQSGHLGGASINTTTYPPDPWLNDQPLASFSETVAVSAHLLQQINRLFCCKNMLRAIYPAGERDPVYGALNKAVPISKTAWPMSRVFCGAP